jgi:hypothetical protein
MNERIKELAEQASHQSPDGYPVTIPYSKDFAEKFAELIVRECAGVCEDYRGTNWGKAAECIGYSIKEHFGVEE